MSANHQSNALFIGGLLESTASQALTNYFSQFGEIKGVNLIIDWVTGKSKRCAIVSCQDSSTINNIISSKPHYLEGKLVRVDIADKNRKGTKIVRTTKIFLGHIPQNVEQIDLLQFFMRYGEIKHLKIIRSAESSSNGYLEFYDVCDAQKLLKERHNVIIKGHKIFCQPFKAKTVQEGQFLKMISNFGTKKLEHCLKIYFQMQVGSMSKTEQREFFHSFGQYLYSEEETQYGNRRQQQTNVTGNPILGFLQQGNNNYQKQPIPQTQPKKSPTSEKFKGWNQFQSNLEWKAPINFKLTNWANRNQNQGGTTNNFDSLRNYQYQRQANQKPQNAWERRFNSNLDKKGYQFPSSAQGNFYTHQNSRLLSQGYNPRYGTRATQETSNFNVNPSWMLSPPLSAGKKKKAEKKFKSKLKNKGFTFNLPIKNSIPTLPKSEKKKYTESILLLNCLGSESPQKRDNNLLNSFTATTASRHSSEDGEERISEGMKFDSLFWLEEDRKRGNSVRSEEDIYEDELLREATNVGCHSQVDC